MKKGKKTELINRFKHIKKYYTTKQTVDISEKRKTKYCLRQLVIHIWGLANYCPRAKASCFVNSFPGAQPCPFTYVLSLAAFVLQWQLSITAGALQPEKPKIFPILFFTVSFLTLDSYFLKIRISAFYHNKNQPQTKNLNGNG